MNWFFRVVALVLFGAATLIRLDLFREFTGSSDAWFLVMGCAVACSAFGLSFARAAANDGNWLTSFFSAVGWVGCAALCVWMEFGAWEAMQNVASDTARQAAQASAGQILLADTEIADLRRYANARAAQDVQADIDALLSRVVFRGQTLHQLTDDCARPGIFASECGDFSKLKIERARSERKEELTKKVGAPAQVGAKIENARALDLSEPAKALSRRFKIDEQDAKDLLIILMVFVLFVCGDGMLFVATSPRKRKSESQSKPPYDFEALRERAEKSVLPSESPVKIQAKPAEKKQLPKSTPSKKQPTQKVDVSGLVEETLRDLPKDWLLFQRQIMGAVKNEIRKRGLNLHVTSPALTAALRGLKLKRREVEAGTQYFNTLGRGVKAAAPRLVAAA